MLDRRVGLTRLDVVEDVVTVREGAALGVLAGEPNWDPFDEQAREGERLGLAPVDPALVERLRASIELLLQFRVDREAFRGRDEGSVELAQTLHGDGRDDLGAGAERDPPLARHGCLSEGFLETLMGLLQLRLDPTD